MNSYSNRKAFLKNIALGAAAVAATPAIGCIAGSKKSTTSHSNKINHSVCYWCINFVPLEAAAQWAKKIGIGAIDLLAPKEWSAIQKYGLSCSMCYTAGKQSLTEGWNNTTNHDRLINDYLEAIPLVAAAGYKNLICFSGNRKGMDDATGLQNCVEGLKQIIPLAEKHGVVVQMELFNSKIDHPDYMADKSAWGVALCKKLGSDNFKLLYDIYHMQINEGDVIRTIQNNHFYFGHYHTAGVPGRHEIDETQELYYPAIMNAIANTGFKGYVAQEFLANGTETAAKLKAFEAGIKICDI